MGYVTQSPLSQRKEVNGLSARVYACVCVNSLGLKDCPEQDWKKKGPQLTEDANGHIPVSPCLSVLLSVRQGVQQYVCNLSPVLLCRVLILNHSQKQLSLETNNTVSCDCKLQITQGQFQFVNYLNSNLKVYATVQKFGVSTIV